MKILQEIFVPKETVNDEYVTIAKLYFNTGDEVKTGDIVIDIETSKTIISIETEYSGFIKYLCEEGDEVRIGTLIIKIYDVFPDKEDVINVSASPRCPLESPETIFSTAALQFLKKHKIDKTIFSGRDFVSIDDVRDYLEIGNETSVSDNKPEIPVADRKPDKKSDKKSDKKIDLQNVEIKKLTPSKKSEISYLSDVQCACLNSVANVFVDVRHIFEFTNNHLEIFKDSLLPIIVYETSRLLRQYKELNAYFVNENIAYYKDVHIGMAVDVDDGLKVLKIPDTDKKDLRTLENEIFDLLNKYMDKALAPDNVSGTTFTITDLSSENVNFFIPLINKAQSAILGVSAIDRQLQRCVLTLTFDHRVTEGKKASQFLNELRIRIESYKNSKNLAKKSDTPEIRCYQCLKTPEEDKAMEGPGLIRIVNHNFEEVYICHVCLKGM